MATKNTCLPTKRAKAAYLLRVKLTSSLNQIRTFICVGLIAVSIVAQIAGDKVKALIEENVTAVAIVTANC